METGFHFKKMAPPEEVLPNGACEYKCLVEKLCGWFAKCTGESITFDFPRRIDTNGCCILFPEPHPKCLATSCTSGKECRQQWANQFGTTSGTHSIAQWLCPGGNIVLVGCLCIEKNLLGFGKVVLHAPQEPRYLSLIKNAVRGTLREMELAFENSILKQKLETGRAPISKSQPSCQEAPGKQHPAVVHSLEYIAEHYRDHALSLVGVADAVGISSCHLSCLFHQNTGTTFHEHLRDLRLEAAKELKEASALTHSEIARRTGFDTPRNLRRALQQIHGK